MSHFSPPPTEVNFLRRSYSALKEFVASYFLRLLCSAPDFGARMAQGIKRPISDSRVRLGRYTYGIYSHTVFMARNEDRLTIGNFCSIADGVRFIFGNHPIDTATTFPLRTVMQKKQRDNVDAISRGPILIGNDVWIASNAIILSGVTIGDGAVIGAGSVVTRDVAPYSLTAGVPARHIRFRFDEHQIEKLLQIQWWNWPDEAISANMDAFYGKIEAFTQQFTPAHPTR